MEKGITRMTDRSNLFYSIVIKKTINWRKKKLCTLNDTLKVVISIRVNRHTFLQVPCQNMLIYSDCNVHIDCAWCAKVPFPQPANLPPRLLHVNWRPPYDDQRWDAGQPPRRNETREILPPDCSFCLLFLAHGGPDWGPPMKHFGSIIPWYTGTSRGTFSWAPMIPREASLSKSCAHDGCRNSPRFCQTS